MTNQGYVLYLQISCEQAEETLKVKNLVGLMLTVIVFSICLFFQLALNSMAVECAVEAKQSQMFLVTPDDYAVGVEIEDEVFAEFKEKEGADLDWLKEPIIVGFEVALKKQLNAKMDKFLIINQQYVKDKARY